MSERVAVIGDGAMGTICAIMLAENGHRVRFWSAFPEAAEALAAARENRRFLPGVKLPDSIEVTGRDEEAMAGASLAISAVPTQFMRSVWTRLGKQCPADLPICSVTKGIENHTLLCPSGILQDVLGPAPDRIAVLSGPSIAPEIACRQPATVAVAGPAGLARRVQRLISRPYFRVYTNPDMIGVEIAGATKNVIAIAAGMLDGLGFGSNAKAALLTRGLAEITRLGRRLHARAATFAGLAGVGDLVTTCISPVGRNRSFGEALGRGSTVAQALGATDSVVEGVATTASVIALAHREQIEMPITEAVAAVLGGRLSPTQAVEELMRRPLKAEEGHAQESPATPDAENGDKCR
ncbi:MAG: NAD(P)-dependent glycerol-3-phosphate dehydrogenase [Planctomycetota bacterium]|nr:NAD(P)-dependent glycerol-3-phosphate dehydrogenase [Planctomycetota bacterium]